MLIKLTRQYTGLLFGYKLHLGMHIYVQNFLVGFSMKEYGCKLMMSLIIWTIWDKCLINIQAHEEIPAILFHWEAAFRYHYLKALETSIQAAQTLLFDILGYIGNFCYCIPPP